MPSNLVSAKYKSKRPTSVITTRKPATEQAIPLDYYEALYSAIYNAIIENQHKAKKYSEITVINNLLTIAKQNVLVSVKLNSMIDAATMHMTVGREATESFCFLFKRKVPFTQLDNICQLVAGFELRNLNMDTLAEFKQALSKITPSKVHARSTIVPMDDQLNTPMRAW